MRILGEMNAKVNSHRLSRLNWRLQLQNPEAQYSMSWFTAHKIGLRLNLWLSILFIHSHFIETNQRFAWCCFHLSCVDLDQHNCVVDNRCLSSGWTMRWSNTCVDLILFLSCSRCTERYMKFWDQEIDYCVTSWKLSLYQSFSFIRNNLTIC